MYPDPRPSRRMQRGFSLMEVLVATSISLVVTAAMVGLMINSLSNTSRVVKMTKLTDDMRIALQMMTRDVRRSNYSADAVLCFANPDCARDGTVAWSGDVQIAQQGDCFIFQLDRDFDGDMTENAAGAFRRVVQNGVGLIEMWTGESVPDCAAAGSNWAAITDPNDIEITTFSVDDALSYDEVIFVDPEGNEFTQKVRKIRLSLSGRLNADETITREIEDVVKLRNNLYM